MAPVRNDEPAVLEIGQEVSARFDGAFCEAKIRGVTLDVRLKVRDPATGENYSIRHYDVRSDLKDIKIQNTASVRLPQSRDSQPVTATVNVLQVIDYSSYDVEFNDGDRRDLKRTLLHPKSGKHFDESTSLDNMPLTQPEKVSNAQTKEGSVASSAKSKRRNSPSDSEESDESETESVRRSTRSRRLTATGSRPVGRPKRERPAQESESSQTHKGSPDEAQAVSAKKGRPPRKPAVTTDKPASTSNTAAVPEVVRIEKRQSKSVIKEEPLSSPSRSPPRKRAPAPDVKSEQIEKPATRSNNGSEKTGTEKPKESEREEKAGPPTSISKEKAGPSTSRNQREKRGRDESKDAASPTKKVAPDIPSISAPSEQRKAEIEVAVKQEAGIDTGYPLKSIVCVPQTGRKKFKWLPGLVVHPECRKKGSRLDSSKELLVRLFSSGNFLKVLKNQVKPFSESLYNEPEEDRIQTFNPDYALLYFRDQTLPPTWQPTLFTPFDQHEGTDEGDDGEDSGGRDDPDDESEANRFMIQFIKYRDESGHPYDGEPTVLGRTVDMYKLYREVHHVGGFNRCTQDSNWPEICETLNISREGADSLKNIYQTHFHGGFETFFRTLASSISDIRLGRKRHQYTAQESQPAEPARPKAAEQSLPNSPQPSQPPKRPLAGRPRGRPPGTTKSEKAASKEKSVEPPREEPKVPPISQPQQTIKREKLDDSKVRQTAADGSLTAVKNKIAPNTPDIKDTSQLKAGAVVEVLYHNKKAKKVLAYNARILDNLGDIAYYVHYAHWNKRYDEWIPLQAIIKTVDISEIGAKQYLFNASLQARNRNKLKGPEWNKWRQQIDALLGDSESSLMPGTSSDQASVKSGSEVREDSGSRPEPTVRVAPKRSISRVDDEKGKNESDTKTEKETKQQVKIEKGAVPMAQKPSKRGNAESEKVNKSIEAGEKGKGMEEGTAVTAEPVSEPQQGMEITQKKKSPVLPSKACGSSQEDNKEKVSVAESASKPTVPAVDMQSAIPVPKPAEKKEKREEGKSEKEKEVSKPGAEKVIPKDTSSAVKTTGPLSTEKTEPEKTAPATAKRGRPSNKSKQLKLEEERKAKEHVSQDTLVESAIKMVTPPEMPVTKQSEPDLMTAAPSAEADDSKAPRKRGRTKKVPDAAPELSANKEVSAEPVIQSSQAATTPTIAGSPKSAINDKQPVPIDAHVPTIVVDTPVEEIEAKLGVESVPKEKKLNKKRKMPVETPKDIVLTAPAFAGKHRAALERLKLPLDGSEGSGGTSFEEDEFGNLSRVIVEGIDLTDPDISDTPLVGARRIDTYEQSLNDILIVSQLLIHRLATGYHILERYRAQESCADSKSAETDSGRTEDEGNSATNGSGAASSTSSRPKSTRSKS